MAEEKIFSVKGKRRSRTLETATEHSQRATSPFFGITTCHSSLPKSAAMSALSTSKLCGLLGNPGSCSEITRSFGSLIHDPDTAPQTLVTDKQSQGLLCIIRYERMLKRNHRTSPKQTALLLYAFLQGHGVSACSASPLPFQSITFHPVQAVRFPAEGAGAMGGKEGAVSFDQVFGAQACHPLQGVDVLEDKGTELFRLAFLLSPAARH